MQYQGCVVVGVCFWVKLLLGIQSPDRDLTLFQHVIAAALVKVQATVIPHIWKAALWNSFCSLCPRFQPICFWPYELLQPWDWSLISTWEETQASCRDYFSSLVGHMSMQLYWIRGGLELGGPSMEAGWGETKALMRVRMGGSDGGAPNDSCCSNDTQWEQRWWHTAHLGTESGADKEREVRRSCH